MKWFKHYTNAHDNNDLTKLRMRHGAEGYAIYWYCLELIAGDLGAEENITFELKHDAEVIGFNLRIDSARVEEIMIFMVKIGLFERSDNYITCMKLAKYLDKKTTRNGFLHKVIDAYTNSENAESVGDNRGLSGTSADESGQIPLDRDIERERDIEKLPTNVGNNNIDPAPDKPKSKSAKKNEYPDWFEAVWATYPKRLGSNDKGKAFKSANARIKEGKTFDNLIAATERYRLFVIATGKLNTEYVKQGATFFGSSENLDNEWLLPAHGAGFSTRPMQTRFDPDEYHSRMNGQQKPSERDITGEATRVPEELPHEE